MKHVLGIGLVVGLACGNAAAQNGTAGLPREVRGRLALEGEGPLPIVGVSFQGRGDPRFAAVQYPEGTFAAVLPDGEWRQQLVVRAKDYEVGSVVSGSTDLLSAPLRVTGPSVPEIVVTLRLTGPTARVRGHVLNASGQPAVQSSDLTVSLYRNDLVPLTVPVALDGSFEFPRVPFGRYSVGVRSRPSVPILVDGDITDLRLPPTAPANAPVWRLLRGRIVVGDDMPVPRLSISLRSVGSGGQDSSISASDVNFGSYIPEGEYKIEVRDLPQSFYRVKAISYGTVDLLVEPLRVQGEPRPNDEIVVTLEPLPEMPAVRVSGKVVNSMNDGTETPGQIRLYDTRRWSLTTTVGPDGRFEFSNVPPGSYGVGTVPHIESPTRRVTVSTEDLRDLEIILPRKREVRGRIRVEGGYPLPTARLLVGLNGMTPQVYPPSSEEPKIQSDGTFVMTIPEGEHRVAVDHSPHYSVKSIRHGSSDLLKQPLKIIGDTRRDIIVTLEAVAPAAWVSVTGRLGGIDRLPAGVDSVRAVLTKTLWPITLETRLNNRGEFRFPKVPPGTYTLRTEPQVAGMTHKTVVVAERSLSGVELEVPQQRLVTVRAQVGDATSIPGFSLILTENNGRAYRVLTNSFIAMVLDRQDFWCVTDVCSTAPLGLALNEPKVIGGLGSEREFTLSLPAGEHRVAVQFPETHVLRSITFGATDLLKEPLQLAGPNVPDIVVIFAPAQH